MGWSFDAPYRRGGSSRYLSLAFLIVDETNHKYPRRIVRKFRAHYGMASTREVKGADLTPSQLLHFAAETEKLLDRQSDIELHAITVRKEKVQDHIRSDPNKLYNYMINICLLDSLVGEEEVLFTPDPRTIKVSSGDSMLDYLQTQLWFDRGVRTSLIERPSESHTNLNLQFVDVISHMIWRHYEDGLSDCYKIIGPQAHCQHLFFS